MQPLGLACQWSGKSRGKLTYFKMEIGRLMTLSGLVTAGDQLNDFGGLFFFFLKLVCS